MSPHRLLASECVSPHGPKGGGATLNCRWGCGETQFGRLERKPGTLCAPDQTRPRLHVWNKNKDRERVKEVSVADTECFYQDPDFSHPGSLIPLPAPKKEGDKNLLSCLFCGRKFHKIVNYFCFKQVPYRKKLTNLQIIKIFLTRKMVAKLSEIWIRDPGKSLFRIPYPDPQHF